MILVAVVGVILILIVLGDAFETIVLPRRVMRPVSLARLFYQYTWHVWSGAIRSIFSSRHQETFLSWYGPLSLLLLLILWATCLIIGFGLVHWASGSIITSQYGTVNFGTYLYLSGTTFYTLGLGDVVPCTTFGKRDYCARSGNGLWFPGPWLLGTSLSSINLFHGVKSIYRSWMREQALRPLPLRCCAGTAMNMGWRDFGNFFMSGSAGLRIYLRVISPSRCLLISVPTMTTSPGSDPLQRFWMQAPLPSSAWKAPVSVRPN